jgi:uncharacterized membrane protein YqjE
MQALIQIIIVGVIGLIGLGILLSLAFWAMNNIGLLIFILVILFVIALIYSKNNP